MAFSDLEIRNAWEDSLAAGFTPEQIYQGALANFGVTRDQVDRALANTSNISNQQVKELFQAPPATPRTVTTSSGQVYNYDDVVNLINARYAEGKTPALAVKSALQLGFPEDVIRTLPGVDAAAFEEGKRLIESGAFASTATGTAADIQQAAPVGSAQYNARIAAGLDAFGFPPEEVARLTAAGLYGPGKQYDPGPSPELYYSPENERESGGLMTSNVPGRTIYAPTQQELQNTLANISSTASQESMKSYGANTLENALTTAIVGAITGGLLGPAGLGLSQPVAAGIGGAAGTAATGADRDQILLGALLAGGTSYGLENLLGAGVPAGAQQAAELAIADDITQLSQQGLSQNQITNIISQGYGVDPFTAAEAVTSALSSVAPSAAAQTVNVAGTGLLSSAIVPTAVSSLATMARTAPSQSVTVQEQNLPQQEVTFQDLLNVLTPAITAELPVATGSSTQQVEVAGKTVPKTENIISSLVPALTTAAIPATAQAATQPTGTQQVEVAAKKDQSLLPYITSPVIAAIPALPAEITAELPKPLQPNKPEDKSLFTPSDILKVLNLVGALAAGGAAARGTGTGTGVGVGTLPPSDTRIASTTPQYGSDYYNAVQRYYNAYMPETPRDVAGPLQQWYENTYGTAPATGPGIGAMPSIVVPTGSVPINQTIPSIPTMRPQSAVERVPGASSDGFYGIASTQRPQLQSFRELPAEQQKQGADYLASVVPLIAQRSLQSGTGWNDFSQLSQNFRARPEDLLSYMTPDQKKEFESRFNYQLGINSRLFDPERTFTQGSATFQPNIPEYLTQASQLASKATPEQRAELERIIYSGATQGGSPALMNQGLFNVPWWVNATKAEEAIAGLYSGNPQQYFQQQALQKVQAPLSETFSDASKRTIIKGPGGFDISFSKDGTPYIEAVNLFGDRPIERLKETYGLNDQQISELISMIPLEAFNPRKRASEEFGYIPSGLKPYYKGYIEPSGVVPEFKPEDVPRLVREGLIPPGS